MTPRCDTCGKPVRIWQSYSGWGPIGFGRKTADILWHSKCGRTRRPTYRAIPTGDDL